MTSNDSFFKILAPLLVGLAFMFSCARHIEQAPAICKTECEANGATYSDFELKYLIVIGCSCVK